MADLAETITADLSSYYEMVRAETHRWVSPLSDQELWRRPFRHGNSVGHLLLHMTGNLNYYIGARVAETGYLRDREREFTEQEQLSKAQLLLAFDRAIGMVVETLRKQSPQDWLKAYSAEREPEARERLHIFLRCAGHAYHHVGQIIYLSRELRGSTSAD
jgi:uncharacterized damage-inducible protein DinB